MWTPTKNNINTYFQYLNGDITWLKGNHDKQDYISSVKLKDFIEEEYKGIKILFTHDPKTVPDKYLGWIVHGHVHNNYLRTYPFFNPNQRRINVSAEVIGYKPVPISKLLQMILTQKETQFTL